MGRSIGGVDGSGNVSGDLSGDGSGNGLGDGSCGGSGDGLGDRLGDGSGDGLGDGSGDGLGDGSGDGPMDRWIGGSGKLVKHFSRQLVTKARFGEELQRELASVPCLPQWLRVVGLSQEAIEAVCTRVSSLEALRERSDHELRALLAGAREEEQRRLCRAMQRLRAYTEALARGEASAEMQLYWDSWERHGRGSPRTRVRASRASLPTDCGFDSQHSTPQGKKGGKSPTTPVSKRKQNAHLPAPAALTKSRSHESQLSVRPDASDVSDNSQSSAVGTLEGSPPASPHDTESEHTPLHRPGNNVAYIYNLNNACSTGGAASNCSGAPRSPRTPTVGRCMAHDIAHRFTKKFNMIATCDYCEKQMLFGAGLKCKECKFKCHRDCESKVPPSCGLPPEFVNVFKEKFHKDGGGGYFASPVANRVGFLSSLTRRRHHQPPTVHAAYSHGPDSSSNTSSCNSSTPSSPALAAPPTPHHPHAHPHPHPHPHHVHTPSKQQFHFPEVKPPVSSPNHTATVQSPARVVPDTKEDITSSVKSDSSRGVSLSGSGSTDSGGAVRADSLDLGNKHDSRWPRQNSLSMKEWDIPYDELKLFEVIGKGRFGTVYRGSWHGAVAVKLLHVHSLHDDSVPLDTFKHEVATFRKTRHENLVLFMGACMKPPRLAIVTSLCKGNTLYTHIHLRKDKFTANRSVIVAQQISQGMGYLHARGIIHKDLKTKNIFLENGKVVITDFGLFSVTKLCFGNNARGGRPSASGAGAGCGGDSLGIPPGWLCYLAPELNRALTPHASLHLPFSKATDVYAFGTVWYELLCGEYPFKGQPPEAIIWQVGKGVKQSLANMQASRDIKDILMLCWSYRASERPDFPRLLATLQKLPRKRLARSPSHPVQLSRSADSVF
ncbi:kinase suppressor of Ras 2 [Hyposmocoma kahamanoa]|uniref:kinase suppressor of Ras 2 n=1 Tax=Hyposmocoma kahamanoa TaxID=1477025 RepID=UPI000E6D85BF|nr:kinase suppressor of Ras 2 [Hyposmocoma kahamanoa]